ncbi:MAG TPA: hypothetical protein VH496_21390 [Mycobacterium sp.]
MTDPHLEVDALVASLHPDAPAGPGVRPRDVVLVTGPWLAGSTSVADALRQRLPDRMFVETGELADGDAPAAVVFVASAVAPLTESDCVLLDTAAANTDLVIGAVSKIDVHREWRDVLAADEAVAAAHNARFADMTWVGAAAAPVFGEPRLNELTDVLESGLADSDLYRRNRLRAWQSRLLHVVRRHEDAAAGVGREARVTALRQERVDALRHRRLTKSERTIALRSRIQQAKATLMYYARNRCASVRGELAEDAAQMTRRKVPEFDNYVRRRVNEVVREVDAGVTKDLCDLATDFGLAVPGGESAPPRPPVPPPPLAKGGLDSRLMMVLGAVFGLGVAFTLSRLFAGIAPAYTVVGLVVGAVVGLAVAGWVVSMRRVLRDRAVLERWIGDVIGELRAIVEQMVATRLLRAEPALTTQQAELEETEAADVAARIAAIDSELREHALAAAQAAATRDRELPGLQRALDAVHTELECSNRG